MTFLRSTINLNFAQKCHFTQYKIKLLGTTQVDSLVLEPTIRIKIVGCSKWCFLNLNQAIHYTPGEKLLMSFKKC